MKTDILTSMCRRRSFEPRTMQNNKYAGEQRTRWDIQMKMLNQMQRNLNPESTISIGVLFPSLNCRKMSWLPYIKCTDVIASLTDNLVCGCVQLHRTEFGREFVYELRTTWHESFSNARETAREREEKNYKSLLQPSNGVECSSRTIRGVIAIDNSKVSSQRVAISII